MHPFADLHCHTIYSDGTATPDDILDLALKKGFRGLSITDHDTVQAYEGLSLKAKAKGLDLMTGAEFSCTYKQESIHILAYDFDLQAKSIQELCRKHEKRREKRNAAILEKLAFNRMPISFEEVRKEAEHVIGRPHIAQAMVKNGFVKDIKQAFSKYLGEGRPCYAASDSCTVEETIKAIHQARGLAVLAHPHLIMRKRLLKEMLACPFDGMECWYANFTKEQCQKFLTLAEEKKWIQTGGSDYHGAIKPRQAYGASFVTEQKFYELRNAPRKII